MKLSIITINYNNDAGLHRTLDSVAAQRLDVSIVNREPLEVEHIIVDGNSTDESVQIIRDYEQQLSSSSISLTWVSEPDKGIYNAMNKGIRLASGDYIQILNSGDILASEDVTERMIKSLYELNEEVNCADALNEPLMLNDGVLILYGNMIKKDYATGEIIGKSAEVEYSLRQYYCSTMNHDCCYIRRDLFEKYGLYDENLKIVSDWKWFLQTIGLGPIRPVYVDIDVTIFDASGISEQNLELRHNERRQVLAELMPPAVLADYDAHAFEMEQMKRLRRWKLYPLVYFIERVLFKLEKWGVAR
ncbi:MAG: glycosyltransferase family 2 protein [Agathobacter sp.]